MNTTGRGPDHPQGEEMIKVALVAMFVMSMGTLGLAASSLPVEETAITAELR